MIGKGYFRFLFFYLNNIPLISIYRLFLCIHKYPCVTDCQGRNSFRNSDWDWISLRNGRVFPRLRWFVTIGRYKRMCLQIEEYQRKMKLLNYPETKRNTANPFLKKSTSAKLIPVGRSQNLISQFFRRFDFTHFDLWNVRRKDLSFCPNLTTYQSYHGERPNIRWEWSSTDKFFFFNLLLCFNFPTQKT